MCPAVDAKERYGRCLSSDEVLLPGQGARVTTGAVAEDECMWYIFVQIRVKDRVIRIFGKLK